MDSCGHAFANVSNRRFIVVLDLNGDLCHCTPRSMNMVVVPTWIMLDHTLDKFFELVGPKVVLPRLGFKLFWERMSTKVYLYIWSSMKKSCCI